MATMATNSGKGKNKKQNKSKAIPLSIFQAEETAPPQGFNVVSTRKLDWAESMEDDLDDTFTLNYKRSDNTKVLLPTAPKATRGPDIDLNRVPTEPPFKAYIGNLPYDVNQDEIIRYFSKLKVIDVNLPHNNGRLRGFAYAEFPDRQALIDALAMNGDTFRNRQLRVGLAGDNDNARENNREDRQDRTATNWRSNPREDNFSRDNQGLRNGMNDYSDRNLQRNRNDDYGRRPFDGDRGFRPSERGFDRGFDNRSNNYQNERSYDRPNERSYDRPNNRYGNRFTDRTSGPEESREYSYESNDRSYGRRSYDEPNRQPNRQFNDRRNDRNESRREYGFERRGREDEYDTGRNTSPPPSRHSEEERPKERPKLQLQPRSKPLNTEEGSAANSAIFGDAKPVNTAAREQQIEEKLLKEKEESDKKRETSSDERIRRISSGSNHSATSRSRKGSESGRDFDDDYRRNGPQRGSRSRKTSERSDRSATISENAPKYLMTRNKESNNSSKIVSVRNEDGRDQRRRERDGYKGDAYRPPPRMSHKSDEEEDRKGPAYTTSNKFAHLPTEDYDEDGPQTTSD